MWDGFNKTIRNVNFVSNVLSMGLASFVVTSEHEKLVCVCVCVREREGFRKRELLKMCRGS